MTIHIGEKIKSLRKQKDLTQEDLAEFLGVTYQAISRWERREGYPDITMLPEIANFFNITTDELLGINAEKNKQKINEYLYCASNHFNNSEFSECVTMLKTALDEHPTSYELMSALINALQHDYARNKTTAPIQNHNTDIAALGKKILSNCMDDKIRAKAKETLCMHYIYNLNDKEKAQEIINTMPPFSYLNVFIYNSCLADDISTQKAYQQMILDHTHVVVGAIRCYIDSCKHLSITEKINLYEKCNQLYELLFDSEYDYDMLLSNNLNCAKLYLQLNDTKSALHKLTQCANYALMFDSANKLPSTTLYNTTLLNTLPKNASPADALDKHETRNISLRSILLNEIHQDIFKPLSNSKEYNDIKAML